MNTIPQPAILTLRLNPWVRAAMAIAATTGSWPAPSLATGEGRPPASISRASSPAKRAKLRRRGWRR